MDCGRRDKNKGKTHIYETETEEEQAIKVQ